MLRILLLLLAFFQASTAVAQPSAGYYDSAGSLTGKALQKALHDIISNHTVIPYNDLFTCFRKTDVRNDSVVWDMYSDKPGSVPPYVFCYGKGQECGNYDSEADCYNREHTFPRSWFNDATPMLTDLFHLYPTDGYVNNRRANYPFGETHSPSWTSKNGSKVGPCSWPGYSGMVFEPVDEYKGDFARTFLYMAVRYYGEDKTWTGSEMVTGAEPKTWAVELLLSWHRRDSVSTKEINRNNEVCKLQKNRNPFIDKPLFAERIWGTLSWMTNPVTTGSDICIYPDPVSGHHFLTISRSKDNRAEIEIYSMSGSLILKTGSVSNVTRLELKNLLPGFYFLRVADISGVCTRTFVKQ